MPGNDLCSGAVAMPRPPHGGAWAAWLGGSPDDESFIEQVVLIPSGNPTLQYWIWINSEDICGSDSAEVVIGGKVLQSFDLCLDSNTDGWVKKTLDLTAFAGQTVFLSFSAATDGVLNSNFFVDDVSIKSAPPATAEPTPEPKEGIYLPLIFNEY
jgi:hypothetical protein